MIPCLIRYFRRKTVDRQRRKEPIDERISFFYLDPYSMRWVEEGRCVDLYVERCGSVILVDIGGIEQWHSLIYSTSHEAFLALAENKGSLGRVSDEDRARIRKLVVSTLENRFPTKKVVLR